MAKRQHKAITKRSGLPTRYQRPATIYQRPFWLPAISYYFLAIAIAIIVFFFIWGILHEGGDETPWIPAGILSSLILVGAVFLREIFLRNARQRFLIAKRQLDYNLSKIPEFSRVNQKQPKFTLQQNSYMLNQIKEKSDAARILKRLPEGHYEVFEICNEYLNFTYQELKRIDLNSPRFSVIRKGRKRVKKIHKYHLLKWAEIESTNYTKEAKTRASVVRKVESAQQALAVLETALNFYPNDLKLNESSQAIVEFIALTKISYHLEEAEKLVFKHQYVNAIKKYSDILFLINNENLTKRDKFTIEEKINTEIEKLKSISEKEVRNRLFTERLNNLEND